MRKTVLCFAVVIFGCSLTLGQPAYDVLWNFGGPLDGSGPVGSMIVDTDGNLYGVTGAGGAAGCGVVFELSPNGNGWTETVLHSFTGGDDGCLPQAGLVADSAGNLYGTTEAGGSTPCAVPPGSCGVVYELSPNPGGWTESILHSFGGTPDGAEPLSKLTFDAFGNLYGTTGVGGTYTDENDPYGGGTVFQLVPGFSGWSENILYSFDPQSEEGNVPEYGVIFDQVGNLYGTTLRSGPAGNGYGLVYQLSPSDVLPWTETVIRKFNSIDGNGPSSDLMFDESGRLYGATGGGGQGNGLLFRLSPRVGLWAEQGFAFSGSNGRDPGNFLLLGSVAYGMTQYGGSPTCNLQGTIGCGVVFRTNGKVTSTLHKFCAKSKPPSCSDGAYPEPAGVVVDLNGNLYGTTLQGGTYNQGVVFEITP